MENSRDNEWSYTEKSRQEEGGASSQASAATKGTKRKKSIKEQAYQKKKAEGTKNRKPPEKIPIPPLPSELPPINLLHRDILRAWCQQLHLGTKGQKLETYKRLCEYAYPQQKNIPTTAKEARKKISMQSNPKVGKGKKSQESSKKRTCSKITAPAEAAPTPEELPVLEEPPALYEEVSTSVVTTSAPEEVLGSWDRNAASARQVETVQSSPETCDVRWCVVHGKSLPAHKRGWVQLQFHGGQAWVPEKEKGKVSALFLLPCCTFPPPHLEDNMLCPKCVKRNKTLIKSLHW